MTSETYGMGKAQIDYFLDQLRNIGIVDIGVISQYVRSTNRASVELFRVMGGERQVVTGVEVLFVGSNGNGIWSDCVGAPCLLVYPRSVVTSVQDYLINPGKRPYDVAGAKCIPLSTRSRALIDVGFDSIGNFVIQGEQYSVTINENGITYSNADSSVVKGIGTSSSDAQYGQIFSETTDEHTEVYYLDGEGKCAYRFIYTYDGTYTVQRCAYTVWTQEEKAARSDYKNWTWETIWDATGLMTRQLNRQSDDDEKRNIWSETIDPTGIVTRTLKDADGKVLLTETVNPDSSIQLNQTNANGDVLNTISITNTGDITVGQTKAQNTITLKQDGTLTVTTAGAVSITSNDKVTIKGTGITLDGPVDTTDKLTVAGDIEGSGAIKNGNFESPA